MKALLLIFSTVLLVSAQKNPFFHKGRSVTVRLVEWKYSDIAKECETFLGPHGFAAVQLSPVTENAIVQGRPWKERYQPISYNFFTRSGNETQLRDMIKRCNRAKVRVFVELVLNHMASGGDIVGTGGSIADAEMLMYPAIKYNASDFHATCEIKNYIKASEIRECRLLGLPDLNQEKEFVQTAQINLMNRLVSIGIAGFFIKNADYMRPENLKVMFSKVLNLNPDFDFPEKSRPFMMLEVIDYGKGAINRMDYIELGVLTEYRYAKEIRDAFEGENTLHSLLSLGQKHGFIPSEEAIVFIPNSPVGMLDANRILDLEVMQKTQYRMALAFMLADPYGFPTIISGFEGNQAPPANEEGHIISPKFEKDGTCTKGHGWSCEHRWPVVRHMVKFRQIVSGGKINNWADNGHNQAGFCRGNKGFIAFNNEKNGHFKANLPVCVPEGTYLDVLTANEEETDGKKVIKVDEKKKAKIDIQHDDKYRMIAFHKEALLEGSMEIMAADDFAGDEADSVTPREDGENQEDEEEED